MIGDTQKNVGRRIRARRKLLRLSQEKLGEELGYHRTFVGAVERGERNLTLKSVEALAERLGVEVKDLLCDCSAMA